MSMLTFAWCVLVGFATPVSQSEPLSDAALDQAWTEFEAVWHDLRAGTAHGADLIAAYDEHIEPLPFERMTSQQLASLNRMAFQFGTGMGRSLTRLESILEEDPNDLHAMIRLVDLLVWAKALGYDGPIDDSKPRVVALLDRILAHDDLPVTVEDGTAALIPLPLRVYGTDDTGHASQRAGYEILLALLEDSPNASGELAVEIGSRWSAVKAIGFEASDLGSHRNALLPRIRSTLTIAEADPEPTVDTLNIIHRANEALAMLTAAASTRDFVGSEAPGLSIEWSSDSAITSLADLRGRVVLLNFWVTGCGHCINALPIMRQLADRYRDSDLVILGVTSIQGRHFEPGADAPVSTSGDPDREYALMRKFIASQRVSWPIVFTEQSAWNPAYEVRGTPHLTLVDPNGTVVSNDMHPQHGLDQLTPRIDAVLAEFGLNAPTPESP